MRVGLVGGLGHESTIDYYRRIHVLWSRVDPMGAPPIVIDSIDVQAALAMLAEPRQLVDYLLGSLRRLAGAGADFAAITANTPHIVFDQLAALSPIPLISIVETCAEEARRSGLRRPLLLGTRFTMEAPFYYNVFAKHGIEVHRLDEADRTWVHDRYMNELLVGDFRPGTRQAFIALIERLHQETQVDGVILGGTELPLLLTDPHVAGLPVLDTTSLHVAAIVKRLYAGTRAHGGTSPA